MPLTHRRSRPILAVLGAAIYAAGGALIGSMNAGWFGLERNANPVLPALGIGALFIVFGFASSELHRQLRESGTLGTVTRIFLVLGPLFYVLSWLIEFAILGTLALGIGLVCLSVVLARGRLVPPIDRYMVILSALGSLTWNTETLSAFLLVGVGSLWITLSLRLLSGPSTR